MSIGKYLIHEAEYHFRVVLEASSELTPERGKLGCGSGIWITCVSNNTSCHGLLRWVVVSHVVVRVEESVGTFCFCNVVYCVRVVTVMLKE